MSQKLFSLHVTPTPVWNVPPLCVLWIIRRLSCAHLRLLACVRILGQLLDTFRLNTVSHLLLMKHFARFLPPSVRTARAEADPRDAEESDAESETGAGLAKWVHVSARVSSISDNRLGGWYSYRASKAALNQVVRTFDLHIQAKKLPAIAPPCRTPGCGHDVMTRHASERQGSRVSCDHVYLSQWARTQCPYSLPVPSRSLTLLHAI